jgi:type I phosphodiesterase/nucleotide pyrophosphatase
VRTNPPLPRYGERSLAEVVPSLLAALGLPGFDNRLAIEPLSGFCLLVIDGLGWDAVRTHGDTAPFLSEAAARGEPVTAAFPSTTAASLASLGTGLPAGQHGLVGYTFAVPGHDRPMNALRWELYGIGPHVELQDELVPEEVQPHDTALVRAVRAGANVIRVGPPPHAESPFTRAALRGGPYRGAYWDHEIEAAIVEGLAHGPRACVYAYQPDLDTAGHSNGMGSREWLGQLARFDRLVERLASTLGEGQALFVTGDHGMVNLAPGDKIDAAGVPALLEGVRFLGGEARARHVYAREGAAEDVLAAWEEQLGHRMWVRSREEAIGEGWFGSPVLDGVRPRIGDVVAAAHDGVGIFEKAVDPFQWGLVGHHGSMTPQEQLVPLLELRR